MQRNKVIAWSIAALTVSLSGAYATRHIKTVRAAAAAQASSDPVISLNQGWSQADREMYYQISQGSQAIGASGNDARRAFELASINLVNRPTLRAFEQTYEAAVAAGEPEQSTQILAAAKKRWGATSAFRPSQFAETHADQSGHEGVPA